MSKKPYQIDIITLFPDMFKGPFDMSMLWKARDRGLAEVRLHDLREFGLGARRTVDDTPFGGGPGMVLKVEPVVAAIEASRAVNPGVKVVIMTPAGKRYDQAKAREYSQADGLILLCGHYEGFDERIMNFVDEQISIGDFVLTGGELPAMTIADSVIRLLPGVLGDDNSAVDESFSEGLLEYPQYTRPEEWRGLVVPEVLRSGHHAEIAKWRREQSLDRTKKVRPDLLGG